MVKSEQMPESSEEQELEPDDYLDYWYEITSEDTPYDRLERLLAKRHKVLPGELEAFKALKEHEQELGHPLQVTLDETGFHVIPLEKQEK